MNTVWLSAAALLTIGLLWMLHAQLVTGTADTGGRPRGSQLVAALLLFAGTWALIAYLIV